MLPEFQVHRFDPVESIAQLVEPLVEALGVAAAVVGAGRVGEQGGQAGGAQPVAEGFDGFLAGGIAAFGFAGFGIPALPVADQGLQPFRGLIEQPEGPVLLPLGDSDIVGDPVNPEDTGLRAFFNDGLDTAEVAGNLSGVIDAVKIEKIIFKAFFDRPLGFEEKVVDDGAGSPSSRSAIDVAMASPPPAESPAMEICSFE